MRDGTARPRRSCCRTRGFWSMSQGETIVDLQRTVVRTTMPVTQGHALDRAAQQRLVDAVVAACGTDLEEGSAHG